MKIKGDLEVTRNINIGNGVTVPDGSLTIAKTTGLQTALDSKVDENAPIAAQVKTKISYDAKGLVLSGADLDPADLPALIDATKIADGSVDNTEFQYLSGVTSAIQTQIDGKIANSLYDSNSILAADVDDTPAAVVVANSTFLGRTSASAIKAMTVAESKTELGAGSANGLATLDAGGKVPAAQLPSSIMSYLGTWNASTNTPTLADGTGDTGDVYIVSVDGTQNLGSGAIVFAAGDWVVYSGAIWEKSANSNAVASVFSRMGSVVSANGDYTASQVDNVPAGGISSTTVQAALNELDTGKQNVLTNPVTSSSSPATANQLAIFNGTGVQTTPATTLPTAAVPAFTGDITNSAGSLATVLTTVNGNVGTFGSATQAIVITTNGKGLITAASQVTITPAVGSITGLGANVATMLGTFSSANIAAACTNETGSGSLVFGTSPIITTPTITFSTTASLTAGTNAQGQGAITTDNVVVGTAAANPSGVTLPAATVGRFISVKNRGANPINVYPATGATIDTLGVNTSTQIPVGGVMYFRASSTTQWYSTGVMSFTTPALGTPASGVLTNCTGLPVLTGVSGLGAGVATFLGTPSSANLAAAVTDETGSGALVFSGSPTLTTPKFTVLVSAKTNGVGSPYSITTAESGTYFTNEGATAEVYLTLPAAVSGLIYYGACVDSDLMRFVSNGTDTIRDGATISAAGGYCRLTEIGASVNLVCFESGKWTVMSGNGILDVT